MTNLEETSGPAAGPEVGPALASRAAAAVRRQRLRRPDLRGRLVSAPPARHRVVGGVARRAARHVHGRHVSRQPAAAAVHRRRRSIRCGSMRISSSASALFGLVVLFGMPLVGGVYTAIGRHRQASASSCAAIVAGICLLPPTLLMGATLPAIARWVETTPRACRGSASSTAATSPAPSIGSLLAGLLSAARLRHADGDLRRRSALNVARRGARAGRSRRGRRTTVIDGRRAAPRAARPAGRRGSSTSRSRCPG